MNTERNVENDIASDRNITIIIIIICTRFRTKRRCSWRPGKAVTKRAKRFWTTSRTGRLPTTWNGYRGTWPANGCTMTL